MFQGSLGVVVLRRCTEAALRPLVDMALTFAPSDVHRPYRFSSPPFPILPSSD